MKPTFMRQAIGCAVVLLLPGCSGRADIANVDSQGTAIICFGDSLTEGVGASPGHDYPAQLSRRLGRPVINAGASGKTTRQALERLERDALDRHPKLVIVEFGGNDFLQRVPWNETFANRSCDHRSADRPVMMRE